MKKRLVLFFVLLLPFSLLAKINTEKEVVYYEIFPKSKKDLNKELLRKTPIKKDGAKRYADTSWTVYTSYEYKGACRVTKVFVDLNISTVLPKLGKSAKYSVKNPFNKFSKKLVAYQKTHEKFGKQAAKEIEKRVLSFGTPKDCKVFKKRLRSEVNRIVNKYKAKSIKYDEDTDFGRKKGVKL